MGGPLKLVIFGLSITSSWGNGHATLWRGLCKSLFERRHQVTFYERDAAYYAENRDLADVPWCSVRLYQSWEGISAEALRSLSDSDVAIVTSYCPDAIAASGLMGDSGVPVRVFYDLDAPVTLGRIRRGETVEYLGPGGLQEFDFVLSYTGGTALEELKQRLGAKRVAPLYGSVDPEIHRRAGLFERYSWDLSYLGTYAEDRQAALEKLFLEPARRRPDLKFVIGGAQYPASFPWSENIFFVKHLPPPEHPAFYSSSRLTLNVTRRAMAVMGYCPSARLFEAAACGTPVVTDYWDGLEQFYKPGAEILVCETAEDILDALQLGEAELAKISRSALEKTLDCHTARHRAVELEKILEEAYSKSGATSMKG